MNQQAPDSELSLRTRASSLARMRTEVFDVAIIGGGITGAGVALDAVARGFSAALIEKSDFASGTSSRSSKLIHGGLRYLKQFRFNLVRESLAEQSTLCEIAPHLSRPLAFLVPIYRRPIPSPLGASRMKLGLGLSLYDRLAGRRSVGTHRWLTSDEAIGFAPGLDARGLRGCFLYYDCVTDDSRLVIEVIKEAARRGAAVANYAAARALIKSDDRISGVEIEDSLETESLTLRASVVINASGVWSDQVSALGERHAAAHRLRPSKGIHIVVPAEKLNNTAAVLIPSLGEDRFLFVIPWHGRTLIGTTDTDYTGDLDDPRATDDEIAHLVQSAARFFPNSKLTNDDVISAFAGLRPLVGGDGQATTELSREEQIVEEDSGLISIIGGKLTTYRRIAERAMDVVARRIDPARSKPPTSTKQIRLAGGALDETEVQTRSLELSREFAVTHQTAEHLMRSYGANHRPILEILREREELKRELIQGLPHIEAEVVYSARYEMAVTVEDFLSRRTRVALLARDHGSASAARVAELLRGEV